jgi:hypothetical protein
MMRTFIVAACLTATGTASAEAKELSLKFGETGTYSEARVHVFIDSDQTPPRCPCYRFTFAVDDAQLSELRDEKVVLWVVDPVNEEGIRGSQVFDLSPVYPHPESPRSTAQAIFRIPNSVASAGSDMHFQFLTLRRRCSDPQNPTCSEFVTSVQGAFTGSQLVRLPAVSVNELFEN